MKRMKIIPVLLGLLFLLGGCRKEEVQLPANPEEGSYLVYYRDVSSTTLTDKKVTCKETAAEKVADYLVEQMRYGKERSGQYISVIPGNSTYSGCEKKGDVLQVAFTNLDGSWSRSEQVLFQAGLTKTLTQIPGIDFIYIHADNGQPLMNAAGQPVGHLQASDFVDVLGRDVNTMNHATLVLYFADETGTALVTEKFKATYSSTFSIEKFIVEQLIEGPEAENCYQSVPSETKVISVTTKDNICYVNLDDSFTKGKVDVPASVTIYSIVNSLTELSHVNSVQITVEGAADIKYRNEISLEKPLSRNLDYLKVNE